MGRVPATHKSHVSHRSHPWRVLVAYSRPHVGPFERGNSLSLYAQQPLDARLLCRLELQMTFNNGCDKC
jgi:hypothetical protein